MLLEAIIETIEKELATTKEGGTENPLQVRLEASRMIWPPSSMKRSRLTTSTSGWLPACRPARMLWR